MKYSQFVFFSCNNTSLYQINIEHTSNLPFIENSFSTPFNVHNDNVLTFTLSRVSASPLRNHQAPH